MANVLHPNLPQFLAQHQANMMASLSHRLEVARATNNLHLVEQLERERRQIASEQARQSGITSLGDRLHAIKEGLVKAIAGDTELQVREFNNGSDHWWYAFDPETGDCVYADSEVELRLWIKENYRGR